MKKSMFLAMIFCLITVFSYSQQAKPAGGSSTSLNPESFADMQLAVELQGTQVKPASLTALLDAAIQLLHQGQLDTLGVIRIHERCREHVFTAFKQKILGPEEVKETFSTLDKSLFNLLGCERLQEIYKPIYKKDSANPVNLLTVVNGLGNSYCKGCDLYMLVAKKLYDSDTTPENALLLARYFMSKTGYNLAYPLLHKAVRSNNPKVAAEADLMIASLYRFYNRLAEAKDYAGKALALNPDNAMPYVIIGDCYALGSEFCGNDTVQKTAGCWAAMDKYELALSLDPGLKEIVDIRMKINSLRFPSNDVLIQYNVKEGDPVKVECWMNETTRVRAGKAKK